MFITNIRLEIIMNMSNLANTCHHHHHLANNDTTCVPYHVTIIEMSTSGSQQQHQHPAKSSGGDDDQGPRPCVVDCGEGESTTSGVVSSPSLSPSLTSAAGGQRARKLFLLLLRVCAW